MSVVWFTMNMASFNIQHVWTQTSDITQQFTIWIFTDVKISNTFRSEQSLCMQAVFVWKKWERLIAWGWFSAIDCHEQKEIISHQQREDICCHQHVEHILPTCIWHNTSKQWSNCSTCMKSDSTWASYQEFKWKWTNVIICNCRNIKTKTHHLLKTHTETDNRHNYGRTGSTVMTSLLRKEENGLWCSWYSWLIHCNIHTSEKWYNATVYVMTSLSIYKKWHWGKY